jgi:hypothetical protein
MTRMAFSFAVVLVALAAGCSGGPATSRCPAEYPVERDGYCYAATGDGSIGMDGGSTGDTGAGNDAGERTDGEIAEDAASTLDSAMASDTGGEAPDGSSVICVREHPIVEGSRRYCNPGDCFCSDPDSCVPEDIAAACCEVPVVCGGDAGARDASAVICVGEHPRITGMGDLRWCDPGNCYCGSPDNCYPADTAAACCAVAVVCY